jgi:hypothetical protein
VTDDTQVSRSRRDPRVLQYHLVPRIKGQCPTDDSQASTCFISNRQETLQQKNKHQIYGVMSEGNTIFSNYASTSPLSRLRGSIKHRHQPLWSAMPSTRFLLSLVRDSSELSSHYIPSCASLPATFPCPQTNTNPLEKTLPEASASLKPPNRDSIRFGHQSSAKQKPDSIAPN